MKFALVNGQREEAQPKLSGECPVCGSPMVARCGEVNVWHWAHRARRLCDRWWEPESEWHRSWKAHFPTERQEIIHHADDGEKHIADVKTAGGWALEFQYSYIKPEERRSREAFYEKMCWVVNGLRRKRDWDQFRKAVDSGTSVGRSAVRRIFSDECRIAREWVGGPAPVFIDFGEDRHLAWLVSGKPDGLAYVQPMPRAEFIAFHRGTAAEDFDSIAKELPALVATYESNRRSQRSFRDPLRVRGRGRRRRL